VDTDAKNILTLILNLFCASIKLQFRVKLSKSAPPLGQDQHDEPFGPGLDKAPGHARC
jgi:hypothetical protein